MHSRSLKRIVPAPIKRMVRMMFPKKGTNISYQGVITPHNMSALHAGRYAEVFEKFRTLDPNYDANKLRLRVYFVCMFASYARRLDGDFMTAGVSYGVAPRVMYELTRPRRLHLIDPFLGTDITGTPGKYNTDPDFVLAQYPNTDPVTLHRMSIPDCLPMPFKIAFAHLNTTSPKDEADSIAAIHSMMVPGGIIIIDMYAISPGWQHVYDPKLQKDAFTLPTGQGVIFNS